MSAGSSNGSGGIDVDVSGALGFLDILWFSYTATDAKCFSIVWIGSKVGYKHFCIEKDVETARQSIARYLEKNLAKWARDSVHVYFQVLPLADKPKQGRGSSKDVKVGQWLWCDLDYKQTVEKPEFTGCRELEDYALECYYEDSGKWVHVKRPPLAKVIEDVKTRLGIEPSLVVDSGAGYHLYFKLSREVDANVIKRLEEKLVDILGGDPQSKDLARILRLPGSINPRVGRLVSVVYTSTSTVEPEYLEQILESRVKAKETLVEKPREFPTTGRELRELSDTDILRIVEILKEAYRPGYRQYLILYLSGWLAKARVSPLSALKIAKALYESTGDTDPLKIRLSAAVYSYKKMGIDIDSYASEIEALTGVKPYGLEKEIQEEEVKGKSGLQEKLEEAVGEERALAIIHELSEILGTLSPFRDSVIEVLDYEKQLYAVANMRKLVIARARRNGDRLVYKERVANVCPTKITVYINPLGGITKYEIVFEGPTLVKPLTVGPCMIDEIAERLRLEGLVYHSRLLNDVLSAVVQAFIRKKKAEIRTEIESPGFYMFENKVVAVKYSIKDVDKGKLRESLQLLNELAEVWFKHAIDKFSTTIKWGAVAPFSYILKQKGRPPRWLYLYGDSATGKTTLGRIVLRMWGLGSEYEKSGANINTDARLGHILSQSTFPVLVNEPGGVLTKQEIVEMIKNASEGLTARGKYVKGTYVDYPSLAPLLFTSNKFLPQDDALIRRFIVITFSFREKIPLEKQREFKERVEQRLGVLSEAGNCIARTVVNNPNILEVTADQLKLGEILLEKCYELAGLEKPSWLGLLYEEDVDPQTSIVEEFSERFKKLVNDLFARYVSRVVEHEVDSGRITALNSDSFDLRRKLELLLEKNMIPGVRLRDGKAFVMTTLLEEIGLEGRVNLKSLAEILGFEYKTVRLGDRTLKAMVVEQRDIEKLIS